MIDALHNRNSTNTQNTNADLLAECKKDFLGVKWIEGNGKIGLRCNIQ